MMRYSAHHNSMLLSAICRFLFCMGIPVLHGHSHSAWAFPFCIMGLPVLHGHPRSAWAFPFCMGLPVLHGHSHSTSALPFCIGIPVLHGHSRSASEFLFCIGIPISIHVAAIFQSYHPSPPPFPPPPLPHLNISPTTAINSSSSYAVASAPSRGPFPTTRLPSGTPQP